MAKNVKLTDELYEFIRSNAKEDETISDAISRLIDVDNDKGRIQRQFSFRAGQIPSEVYTYQIMKFLQTVDLTTSEIQSELETFLEADNLLERYPADTKVISNRPRWKVTMESTLRKLKANGSIWQDEDKKYSLTDKGSGYVDWYKLYTNYEDVFLAYANDAIEPPTPIATDELPSELRSQRGGAKTIVGKAITPYRGKGPKPYQGKIKPV